MPNLYDGVQPTPFALQQVLLSSNPDPNVMQRLTIRQQGDSFVYGKISLAIIVKNMFFGDDRLDFVDVQDDFKVSLYVSSYYLFPSRPNFEQYVRHPLVSLKLGSSNLLPMQQGQVVDATFHVNLTPKKVNGGDDVRSEIRPGGYFTLGFSYSAPVLERKMEAAGIRTVPQKRLAQTFQEILLPVSKYSNVNVQEE